jgi:hypothetical protein
VLYFFSDHDERAYPDIVMLINVDSDQEFQRYCDDEERRLYHALWPMLTAGVRIQVNVNSVRARDYVTQRGEQVLYREYQRIYRDQYNAVSDPTGVVPKAAGVSDFLIEQTRFLLAQASRKITQISETLRDYITKLMLDGIAAGQSTLRSRKRYATARRRLPSRVLLRSPGLRHTTAHSRPSTHP